MKLKTDLFPYPVLYKGNDDYNPTSEFSSTITPSIKNSDVLNLNIKFHLKNTEIQNRINNHDFTYAVHLEGSLTSYRKIFVLEPNTDEIDIELSSSIVNDKIEINTMIITNKAIVDYSNSDFNTLYYDENYKVPKLHKGEIIAHDTVNELNIDFENKENPNAKSMIRVSARDEDFISIDIDGDFIQVYLPTKAHTAYKALSSSNEAHRQLLLVTIVQPTLMYVLERIKSGEVSDDNLRWYIALLNILEPKGYDENSLKNADSLKVAQELLENPVADALYGFYEWGNENE